MSAEELKEYQSEDYKKWPVTVENILKPIFKYGNITPIFDSYFPNNEHGVTEIIDVLQGVTFNKGTPEEKTIMFTDQEIMKTLVQKGWKKENFVAEGLILEYQFPDGKQDLQRLTKSNLLDAQQKLTLMCEYINLSIQKQNYKDWQETAKTAKLFTDKQSQLEQKLSRDVEYWNNTFEQLNKQPNSEIKEEYKLPEESIMEEIDVNSLFGALNKTGQAKLSDHVKKDSKSNKKDSQGK